MAELIPATEDEPAHLVAIEGNSGNKVHIMLNKQNRYMKIISYTANIFHKLCRSGRIHSRRRLIKQNNSGMSCKRTYNFKPALSTVRKRACLIVCKAFHIKE